MSNTRTKGQEVKDMIRETVQTAKLRAQQEEEIWVKSLIEEEIARIKKELENFKYDKDAEAPEFSINLGEKELFLETREKLANEGFEFRKNLGCYHIYIAD